MLKIKSITIWDKNKNLIILNKNLINYQKKINLKYLIQTYVYIVQKITFKGKGFRIQHKKNVKYIDFSFGHSHLALLFYKLPIIFRKLTRTKIIYLNYKNKITNLFYLYIKYIKQINVYTKRGLRFKKQIIKKRFGKISQLISSLH